MQIKFFEVRDRCTHISAFGILISAEDGPIARRAGYGQPCVLFGKLEGGIATPDCYDQGGARTMRVAHDYIERNWDDHLSGDVIDVEFILGETPTKKVSEHV